MQKELMAVVCFKPPGMKFPAAEIPVSEGHHHSSPWQGTARSRVLWG